MSTVLIADGLGGLAIDLMAHGVILRQGLQILSAVSVAAKRIAQFFQLGVGSQKHSDVLADVEAERTDDVALLLRKDGDRHRQLCVDGSGGGERIAIDLDWPLPAIPVSGSFIGPGRFG